MSFGGCFDHARVAEEVSAGMYSSPEPEDCRCGGEGWVGTDYDTWLHCPYHYTGQLHPECWEDDYIGNDHAPR
ncbi:MAG: hypothetical protein JRC86_00485 [Deltaproteobacteria bacterium]|nr:hypothetical protein [Deltaproteobacteria bacterium]